MIEKQFNEDITIYKDAQKKHYCVTMNTTNISCYFSGQCESDMLEGIGYKHNYMLPELYKKQGDKNDKKN